MITPLKVAFLMIPLFLISVNAVGQTATDEMNTKDWNSIEVTTQKPIEVQYNLDDNNGLQLQFKNTSTEDTRFIFSVEIDQTLRVITNDEMAEIQILLEGHQSTTVDLSPLILMNKEELKNLTIKIK